MAVLGSAFRALLKSKGVSLRRRGEPVVREWYHEVHGQHLLSITDLVKTFPEQGLKNQCLSKVALGERRSHKGWVAIRNF